MIFSKILIFITYLRIQIVTEEQRLSGARIDEHYGVTIGNNYNKISMNLLIMTNISLKYICIMDFKAEVYETIYN